MSVPTGPTELLIALETIKDGLNSTIKDDIKSSRAAGDLEGVLLLLNRIIGELEGGNTVAKLRLSEWHALRIRLVHDEGVTSDRQGSLGLNDDLETVGNDVDAIQQHLDLPLNFESLVRALKSAERSEATSWFTETVCEMTGLIDAYEASMPDVESGSHPSAPASSGVAVALQNYLSQNFPGLPENPVLSFNQVAGGRAKFTAIVRLRPNPRFPERIVLRADTSHGHTGTRSAAEFPVLRTLNAAGFPVPQAIIAESTPTAVGGSFIIISEVEDAVGAGAPFPEDRARTGSSPTMGKNFGRQVAAFLAKLHSVKSIPEAAAYGWIATPRDPRTTVESYIRQFRSKDRAPIFSLATDLALAWLSANPLPEDRPVALVHGDFGAHNILTRSGDLAAVLDWELAHFGDPAEDIGYCRMMLINEIMDWDDFVSAYVDAGGDPAACNSNAVSFHAILAFVNHSILGGSMLRDIIINSGEKMTIDAVSSHWHYYPRICQYLMAELKMAVAASVPTRSTISNRG